MVSKTEKQWVLLAFILLGALALLFAGDKLGSPGSAAAELQSDTALRGGSNGEMLVIPIQIERDRYGLAMLDMSSQNLWIYELNGTGPAHNRLRLFAARSWQYDRLLKQYNTAEPKPEQVRMLLEEEKSGRQPKELVEEQQKNLDVNVADINVVEVNEPNK
jgi:hypothetical protein